MGGDAGKVELALPCQEASLCAGKVEGRVTPRLGLDRVGANNSLAITADSADNRKLIYFDAQERPISRRIEYERSV